MIFDGQCMNLWPPTFHSDVPTVRDGLETDDVVLAKLQLLVKVAEVDRAARQDEDQKGMVVSLLWYSL
jgi:hypothetical protein